MRKQEGEKALNYIFALYNSASVRKYGVEISVGGRIKLLTGSHSVINHFYLGSRSVKFFHGPRSVNEGYRSVIPAQLGVPLSN